TVTVTAGTDASGGTLSAGGNILVSGGTSASLAAGDAGQDVSVTSDGAANAGTVTAARDLTVSGAAASIADGTAGRDIGLSAGGLATAGTLIAGDDIAVSGGSVTLDSATTRGTFDDSTAETDGSNILVAATGDIDVTGTVDAFGDLAIASDAGAVTANILTAADDLNVSGLTVGIASATTRGTEIESGYGASPDGNNITIVALGPDQGTPAIIIGDASSAGSLSIGASDPGASIDAGTLAANTGIFVNAPGAVAIDSADSGLDLLVTSNGGSLDLGSLAADRDITLSAGTSAAVTGATAGRTIQLSAGTSATAGTLDAGGNIDVGAGTVRIGSATTRGTFSESGYGSNITVNAADTVEITGTADAFDDLTVTSGTGRVTANVLSAGDDAVVSGNGLAITSVTSRGTSVESGYGSTPDGSNIVLTATGAGTFALPAILVTAADAANDLTLGAGAAGGSIAATSLTAGRDITGSAGDAIAVTSGNAGRDLALTAGGTLGSADLTAGNNIALAAIGDVTLGNATANGAVALADSAADPVPTNGLITISAGRTDSTGSFAAADIAVTGTLIANGHIQATAGRDIIVGATARLLSDNRITLAAGDDILLRAGSEVRAAIDPLPTTVAGSGFVSPAALVLDAGRLALGYTPAAGDVASVIVDGTIASAARPITIIGGAVQADGSTLTAGSLSVGVVDAPAAGAARSDDNGGLRADCLQGDICLGGVTLTGFTAAGGIAVPGALTIGADPTLQPTNVRIAGPVDVASMNIVAKDGIVLGNAAATGPIVQTVAGPVQLNAVAGSVDLLGPLTLTGGVAEGTGFADRTVSILAGTDVNGTGAAIVARGPLTIGAGGNVTLAFTSSAEATRITATGGDIRVGTLTTSTIEDSGDGPGSGVLLTARGNVGGVADGSTADIDATGDVLVRAGGDVALGSATARSGATATDEAGSDIDIVAGGAVRIADSTAADDARITAGTSLTIGSLATNGAVDGGAITLAADTIDAGSLTAAGDITARAASLLAIDAATTPGAVILSASGTDLPPTDGTPDGILAAELGTIDAGTRLSVDVAAGGIRFAGLSAPELALTAGTRIVGGSATARAGGASFVAPGDVALDTITATGAIAIEAGGAVTATSLLSAIDSDDATPRGIDVTAGGTIEIGAARADRGNLTLASGGALSLGTGSAGDAILLSSTGGAITAGTLNATGTIALLPALSLTLGDATTGGLFYVADPATLADLPDVAGPADLAGITPRPTSGGVDITGTVSAGQVVIASTQPVNFATILSTGPASIRSDNGTITGGTLRAGGDIALVAGQGVRIGTDIASGGAISVTAADIALNALGNLTLDTANATSGNLLLASAGGAITIDRGIASGAIVL
ncbi:MAG: hypothetical protein ABW128_05290, partial [Rhizorhabdus sp.]